MIAELEVNAICLRPLFERVRRSSGYALRYSLPQQSHEQYGQRVLWRLCQLHLPLVLYLPWL